MFIYSLKKIIVILTLSFIEQHIYLKELIFLNYEINNKTITYIKKSYLI